MLHDQDQREKRGREREREKNGGKTRVINKNIVS
jgi:hypothetical protein